MYLEHYGLREAPFRITPHTDFFFAGGNRGATLEALIYAISNDEGIVKVTGEVGSGKTMLCRMLLEKLPATVETVYLANPSYSRDEILHALAAELQLELPEGRPSLLLKALQERLLQSYAAGRRVVVLIDEAHAMPGETLEEIRLLSNLESSRHKLLQIVLFGQPELDERLAQPDLRQLKERITHNFGLEPLRRTDIGPYLMFRLRAAGYHGPDIFSPRALQGIDTASEGLTRRINILADKAMLAAFAANTHLVDQPQVQAAVTDAQFTPLPAASNKAVTALRPILLVLPLGLALTFGAYWAGRQSVAATPSEAAVSAPQFPAATPSPATASATATPAATSPAQDSPATPAPESVPQEAQAAPPSAATAKLPADLPQNAGRLTREALAAHQSWLAQADDRHYVLQLLAVKGSATREVESFLTQAARSLPPGTLRAYYRSAAEGPRWGVTYGDFPDRSSAVAALAALPEAIRNTRPYPRQVQRLR
ncbi:AAA family ATPase [Azospira sp. I09]|uniref:AAA family ATPase n=1 Tax=Azospira sp. I09 TaxID=1765049 RepID=UPI001260F401|nr:AAA family ATPase [Azospira sp. I09]BBN90043.1 hypothetical protein AZSP09_30660 [Azospira sp. I09]